MSTAHTLATVPPTTASATHGHTRPIRGTGRTAGASSRVTDIRSARSAGAARNSAAGGVRPTRPLAPVTPATPASRPAASGASATGATPPAQNTTAREARGFVLYVGLDEAKAQLDGVTLTRLVEALKRVTGEVAPHAETYAAVALAPKGTGGRDIDVVRLALGEPQALAEYYGNTPEHEQPTGVTIDTTRRRVLLGGENVGLTYKEFELLQALVLREGRTVERTEIIDTLWRDAPEERPNERTIDVHVRRLRSKLGPYADIVRTVRGTGYRFDRHADVEVVYGMAQSPDRF